MERIKIGQIVNAVALRGEVKIYNYSDLERFEELDTVILVNRKKQSREFEIESVPSFMPTIPPICADSLIFEHSIIFASAGIKSPAST